MSGTQKSILVKSHSKRKTQKKHVRIHSPANQIIEFKRGFGKEDVNNLWSNGQDLQTARMSREDKDPTKAPSLDRQQRKKRHINRIKHRENAVFYNRKKAAKEAALVARDVFGIKDVESPTHTSSRSQKKGLSRIVWPSDSIRSTVSASQMRHSPTLNRSRRSEPVPKKTNVLSPHETDKIKKRSSEPLTLWERMFGK